MGVKGLWSLLQPCEQSCSLDTFAEKALAVDLGKNDEYLCKVKGVCVVYRLIPAGYWLCEMQTAVVGRANGGRSTGHRALDHVYLRLDTDWVLRVWLASA